MAKPNSLVTAKKTGNFKRFGRFGAKIPLEKERFPASYGQIPDAIGTGNSFGRTGNSYRANRGKQEICSASRRDVPGADSTEAGQKSLNVLA
jgi:hypothetical protein